MKYNRSTPTPGLTRREFLKIAGISAVSALLLSRDFPGSQVDLPEASAVPGPQMRLYPGDKRLVKVSWSQAVHRFAKILQSVHPSEIAFLVPFASTHLLHLVRMLGEEIGGAAVFAFDEKADSNGQIALLDASRLAFGINQPPLFDLSAADLIFSFGNSFQEPWIASPSYAFSGNFTGNLPRNPEIVLFSARKPVRLAKQYEWIPIRAGSDGLLAAALYRQILAQLGFKPPSPSSGFVWDQCDIGISQEKVEQLAARFVQASKPLALPGWAALTGPNGSASGRWILVLNSLKSIEKGNPPLFLAPPPPVFPLQTTRPASAAEMGFLARRICSGKVKVLAYQGVDPLHAFPGVQNSLLLSNNRLRLVSLSSTYDPGSDSVDLFLPDHPFECSSGYHIPASQADFGLLQAIIPRNVPGMDTRSSVDVLLEVSKALGLRKRLPFDDEQAFLRNSIASLIQSEDSISTADPDELYDRWLTMGAWQRKRPVRFPPRWMFSHASPHRSDFPAFPREMFQLLLFPHQNMSEGKTEQSAWAEIHPETAHSSGLKTDDLITLSLGNIEVRLSLRLNPGIHPSVIAVPFIPGDPVCGSLLAGYNTSGGRIYTGQPVRIARVSTG